MITFGIPQRLNEIIPLLKDSYRGIDVRGVLSKSRSEDRWYYVFLKIRLTKDDPTKLQEIYHKKHEQLGRINHDDFKVVFDSRDIRQLETFLNEIQNGPIILNGIVAWPIGTESQNIFENLLSQRNGSYSTEHERDGFNDLMVFISKRENPEVLVHQLGVSTETHNLKFHEVSSWLDIELNALSHSNYIIIILPMYCKHVEPAGTSLAKYSIHQSLRIHCSAIITSNDGHVLKRLEFKDMSLSQNGSHNQKQINTISIPMIDRILPGNSVQIEVRHDILGQICTNRITVHEISEGKNQEDKYPLSRVFLLSKARERFHEYLVNNNAKTQVSATTWLLNLLGFNCINLGAFRDEDENMMHESARLHAIDIISYHPTIRLFLACDCTINPPASDKIDKIRNAAKYVGGEINGEIVPVIFCNKDCTKSCQEAKDAGVNIIDLPRITQLSDLILHGKIDEALTLIRNLLLNPTTDEDDFYI